MEKIILKTIREAFKIAYINKLIKESSEEMAKKLTQDQLRVAENMYNRWISGRLNLELGKQDDQVLNYIIEKGSEEYKQTKDSRLRDAIASAFYPNSDNGGNKMYKILINYKPFLQNIKKRFGEKGWRNVSEDAIANAFVKVVMDPTNFEKIIDSYKGDISGSGIVPLFVNHLQNGLAGISAQLASPKRGGKAGLTSYDDPESFVSGKVSGEEDDKISSTGSDVAVDPMYSGIDTPEAMVSQIADLDLSDDHNVVDVIDLVSKTFDDAANYFMEAAKRGEVPQKVAFLISKMFKEGKGPTQVFDENPEVFAGTLRKSITAYPTSYFGMKEGVTNKYFDIVDKIGVENGLHKGWFKSLLEGVKQPFYGAVKVVRDAKKGFDDKKGPDTEGPKGPEGWSPLFEKKIEDNMDAIIKEVYKRLAQTK